MFSFIKKLFKPSLLEESERGDVDAVNQCISDGQDVNMKDKDGRSSLLVAAMEGHKTIVEILLAKGADVNAGDEGGGTPLDGAESLERRDDYCAKHNKIADLLRKHGAKTGEELKAEGKCVMY